MNEAVKYGGRRGIKVPIMPVGLSKFEMYGNGDYGNVSVNGLFFSLRFFQCLLNEAEMSVEISGLVSEHLDFLASFHHP